MRALVIAGGVPQIELMKQMRERGIESVLLDGGKTPVALPYADRFYQVNIFDIDAVTEIARKEKADFVITVCADQVLLVMAEVSERLGLPCYIDFETGKNVSDKLRMKKIFRENGIPTSLHVETNRLDLDEISHLRYPLVVKPVDAYSSRGVRKAETEEELIGFYNEAASISRSGGVIVEEFCEGEEISVDAFVVNGKSKVLLISNSEKVKDKDRFVIFRGRYPAAVTEALKAKIEVICQKIVDAFGLVNCPLLVQLLSDGENVSVLEFCARTGGCMKYLLIRNSCGVDVISAALDLSLGIEPEIKPADTGNRYVVNDFIYGYPGVFDHLEGFEELKNEGILNEYFAIRPAGFEARGVTSSSDRIAGVNICAGSLEEFREKHKAFLERTRVADTEGRDIMRRDLLPELK